MVYDTIVNWEEGFEVSFCSKSDCGMIYIKKKSEKHRVPAIDIRNVYTHHI